MARAATTRATASATADARIAQIYRDRWIDYSRARNILSRLNAMLTTPRRSRMPCLLIYGDSGVGKTMLVEKFLRDHQCVREYEQPLAKRSVMWMQMPPLPRLRQFYGRIIQSVDPTFFMGSYSPGRIEALAMKAIECVEPRLMIIDEVHHLLACSAREQRASLNAIKFLSNEFKLTVAAIGTYEALHAIRSDEQTSSRFDRAELPRWTETDEFRSWLSGFVAMLPLKKASNVTEQATVNFVLDHSAGVTGVIADLLRRAAETAIRNKTERIELDELRTAADQFNLDRDES